MWLCGFTTSRFRLGVPNSLFLCSSIKHSVHFAWGRDFWSICVSCVCLFIFVLNIFVPFLFLLVSWVGCGLWLWYALDISFNFFRVQEEKEGNKYVLSSSQFNMFRRSRTIFWIRFCLTISNWVMYGYLSRSILDNANRIHLENEVMNMNC